VIPVQQEILPPPGSTNGHDAQGRPGDCLRACVASLLEQSLHDVPHFVEHDDWWGSLRSYIAMWSVGAIEILHADPQFPVYAPGSWPEHVIATGPSRRGPWLHSVLVNAATGQLAHDPHPDGGGLAGPPVDMFYLSSVTR
jgi:hypothetical protein